MCMALDLVPKKQWSSKSTAAVDKISFKNEGHIAVGVFFLGSSHGEKDPDFEQFKGKLDPGATLTQTLSLGTSFAVRSGNYKNRAKIRVYSSAKWEPDNPNYRYVVQIKNIGYENVEGFELQHGATGFQRIPAGEHIEHFSAPDVWFTLREDVMKIGFVSVMLHHDEEQEL